MNGWLRTVGQRSQKSDRNCRHRKRMEEHNRTRYRNASKQLRELIQAYYVSSFSIHPNIKESRETISNRLILDRSTFWSLITSLQAEKFPYFRPKPIRGWTNFCSIVIGSRGDSAQLMVSTDSKRDIYELLVCLYAWFRSKFRKYPPKGEDVLSSTFILGWRKARDITLVSFTSLCWFIFLLVGTIEGHLPQY